jgi:hypothetical protein
MNLHGICKVFLDPSVNLTDAIKVGYTLCGHDIRYPEPDADGNVHFTQDSLKTMSKFQLKLLDKVLCVPRCEGETNKAIIASILTHTLVTTQNNTLEVSSTEPIITQSDLDDMNDKIRRNHSKKIRVCDEHSAHYNLEDRINRSYFQHFDSGNCRNSIKLFFMSLVVWIVLDAHAI